MQSSSDEQDRLDGHKTQEEDREVNANKIDLDLDIELKPWWCRWDCYLPISVRQCRNYSKLKQCEHQHIKKRKKAIQLD